MALTTFSDLVQEAREQVKRDALAAGCPTTEAACAMWHRRSPAYADAVAVYLNICGQLGYRYCATDQPMEAREAIYEMCLPDRPSQ